jgi:hypothetical protein
MKTSHTSSITIILFLVLAIGCKKDDPAAPGGCNFTFKGKSYTSNVADCKSNSLTGLNIGSWILTMDVGAGIVGFDLQGSSSGGSYVGTGSVSKSGNTVSFNTEIEDNAGDSGFIVGKCTCTQGSL